MTEKFWRFTRNLKLIWIRILLILTKVKKLFRNWSTVRKKSREHSGAKLWFYIWHSSRCCWLVPKNELSRKYDGNSYHPFWSIIFRLWHNVSHGVRHISYFILQAMSSSTSRRICTMNKIAKWMCAKWLLPLRIWKICSPELRSLLHKVFTNL